MELQAFLKKRLGPLPMGAWIFIAIVVGIALVKLTKGSKSTTGGTAGDSMQSGQFSSSITRTDPKTGETVAYNANGPNSSIQSPAQMLWGASPMGYSGGDVYVNIPGQAEHGDNAYVQRGNGFWYVVPFDAMGGDLAGSIQAELKHIVTANPQIDWTGKSGKPIKAGTAIWIPQAPAGVPGGPQPGPAPSGIVPPVQQTSSQVPAIDLAGLSKWADQWRNVVGQNNGSHYSNVSAFSPDEVKAAFNR